MGDDIDIEELSNKIKENNENLIRPYEKYLFDLDTINEAVKEEAVSFNEFLKNHGTDKYLADNIGFIRNMSKIINDTNARAFNLDRKIKEKEQHLAEYDKKLKVIVQSDAVDKEQNEVIIEDIQKETKKSKLTVKEEFRDESITNINEETLSQMKNTTENKTSVPDEITNDVKSVIDNIYQGSHKDVEINFEDFQKSEIHNILKSALSKMVQSWKYHLNVMIKDTADTIGGIISDVKLSIAGKEKKIIIEQAKYAEKAMVEEVNMKNNLLEDLNKLNKKLIPRQKLLGELQNALKTTKELNIKSTKSIEKSITSLQKEIDYIVKEKNLLNKDKERSVKTIRGYKQDLIAAKCTATVRHLPLEQQLKSYLSFIENSTKDGNALEFSGKKGETLCVENTIGGYQYFVNATEVKREDFTKHLNDHSVKEALIGYETQKDIAKELKPVDHYLEESSINDINNDRNEIEIDEERSINDDDAR